MCSIKNKNYRYEKKFLIPMMSRDNIVSIFSKIGYGFKEVFTERRVNNIYFDTLNLDYYQQNKDGIGSREKFRVRWYGDLYGEIDPTIEIKTKESSVGTKSFFKIDKMHFNESTTSNIFREDLIANLSGHNLVEKLYYLFPTLLNTYERKYYISNDSRFRITIDFNVKSNNLIISSSKHNYFSKVEKHHILELKYDQEHDLFLQDISNNFPFRVNKFSKYVNGINSLNS